MTLAGSSGSHGVYQLEWPVTPWCRDRVSLVEGLESRGLAVGGHVRLDYGKELQARLGLAEGTSAAELVLAAWRTRGPDCLTMLFGEFAFAVYDGEALWLVQSPFVRWPIYYTETAEGLAFHSSARALHRLLDRAPRLHERALAAWAIRQRLVEPSDTFFEGVSRVEPAGLVKVVEGRVVSRHCWWKPVWSPAPAGRDLAELAAHLTDQAVRSRLGSRPVGCYLSGGLDSSTLTALACRALGQQGRRLIAFSSVLPPGYAGPERDEREPIGVMARHFELEVVEVVPTRGPTCDLPGHTELAESPYLFPKQYVFAAMLEAARRRGLATILDGGFGELTLSHDAPTAFAYLARRGRWRELAGLVQAWAPRAGLPWWRVWFATVLRPLLPTRRVPAPWLPLQADFVARQGLRPRFERPRAQGWLPPMEGLTSVLTAVGSSALPFYDRHFGVEVHKPFLDRRLIEFCLTLDPADFWLDGWRRGLVRQAMRDILPRAIVERTDRGAFAPDFFARFRQGAPALRAEFGSQGPTDLAAHYFDLESLRKLLDQLTSRPASEKSPQGAQAKQVLLRSLGGVRFLRSLHSQPVQ
ncbi:MAG: asparagine synthetase B [Vulcanimicrobiota bacterium]